MKNKARMMAAVYTGSVGLKEVNTLMIEHFTILMKTAGRREILKIHYELSITNGTKFSTRKERMRHIKLDKLDLGEKELHHFLKQRLKF